MMRQKSLRGKGPSSVQWQTKTQCTTWSLEPKIRSITWCSLGPSSGNLTIIFKLLYCQKISSFISLECQVWFTLLCTKTSKFLAFRPQCPEWNQSAFTTCQVRIARQGTILSDRTAHARGSVLGFFFRKELRDSVPRPHCSTGFVIVL